MALPSVHLTGFLPAEDTGSLYRLISNWDVVRYMLIPRAQDPVEARHLIDHADHTTPAGERWRTWAIRLSEHGALAGVCGLGVQPDRPQAEIWYLLDPVLWGRGIVSTAVSRVVAIGFGEMALHRIWASCLPENAASVRVLEKCGFRREGLLRKNLLIHGEWRDNYLYAILREEWAATRAQ